MRIRLLLLAVMACIVVGLHAQTPVYNLKSCLEEGLLNNHTLRITRNDAQISSNNATLANAGALPAFDLSAGYSGELGDTDTRLHGSEETTSENGAYDQTLEAGISMSWTLFDGFNITAEYKRLKELERQGETDTRIAIEDLVSGITAEYYNYIQQKIRLKNFRYAMTLSRERVRIAEARLNVGNASGLDYLQAQVDFNSDSAQYIKQQEALHTSRIALNELMARKNTDELFIIPDSIINIDYILDFNELWQSTLQVNASLLRAAQDQRIAGLDYKKVCSRDYPYLRLSGGYGYTLNKYEMGTTSRRSNLGLNFGVTVGFNLFDGNRRRERRNATLAIENARLQREQLELTLHADLSTLWQAYCNNLELLKLERQNLIVAKDNYDISRDRYLLGDLAGIEMREAQKNLLDAEERILQAEYDTKMCEISLLQISGKVLMYLE